MAESRMEWHFCAVVYLKSAASAWHAIPAHHCTSMSKQDLTERKDQDNVVRVREGEKKAKV